MGTLDGVLLHGEISDSSDLYLQDGKIEQM